MTVRSGGVKTQARLALLSVLVATAAFAGPHIELDIKPFKQVVQTKGGVKTTTRVSADSAAPGETIDYEVHYKNAGDAPAVNAVVDDPVPAGTSYVAGSAAGPGSDITFSIDGGKTFAPAAQLFRTARGASGKTERQPASPAEYTHVRWTLKRVEAGAAGTLTFQVRVK
ncbi:MULTISPECIES: DUF11 domain-containing protein [Myxococcaceae]|uniref:DUF11 domain-containing protein n=1 Tax=Myxococcaceae TaxID=31 RepID=UPI00188FCF53|nr:MULTISPECIES: DUF11 domain-containing protein [Myxococcaceae]MBF5041542.1 DUF11 domain-containing protein [Simulacricoccus sp. 17bor-14]